MIREQPTQIDLLAPTWTCPSCDGTGRNPKQPERLCFMCHGARVVDMDPEDFSVIPF